MAIGDSYASVAELELRAGRSDNGMFTFALDAASRDVERWCGRQFNKTTTATARQFFPVHDYLVTVDDFHTTTDLQIATDDNSDGSYETTWAATDYLLEPTDGVLDGMPGWPYGAVIAAGPARRFTSWSAYTRRPLVRVTAQWGWAAVPSPVKEATLVGAKSIIVEEPDRVQSESFDGYSVTYAVANAQAVFGAVRGLARYRRRATGVFAA